ncbi:MAG: Gfo/Idh/MocA family oxidoreductase [Planctomycetota bacterium]
MAVAVGLTGGERAAAAPRTVGANDVINYGVIGYGGRCRYVNEAMLAHADARCVAIADVQQSRRARGKAIVDEHYQDGRCELHRDFRELLDRSDIDAVVIATGDRWHAPASMLAAEAGKDIYSEKPCGIAFNEYQNLADTVIKHKRVFQAGTQRRSVPSFQIAADMALSGKLGTLRTLHASIYQPALTNTWLPPQPQPADEKVDWNLWLGPSPWRPFHANYVKGRWRNHWDFHSSAGILEWGAHTVDLCQWAADADDTTPVEFEPTDKNIICRYANGLVLSMDYLSDPFKNREPQFRTRMGTCPVRFEGDLGSVETGDEGEILASTDALKAAIPADFKKRSRVRGLDVTEHTRNFLDCIRTREKTAANETVMRHSHIAAHAAALSWILGRKLTLDPATETFVDDEEANRMRFRTERAWQ